MNITLAVASIVSVVALILSVIVAVSTTSTHRSVQRAQQRALASADRLSHALALASSSLDDEARPAKASDLVIPPSLLFVAHSQTGAEVQDWVKLVLTDSKWADSKWWEAGPRVVRTKAVWNTRSESSLDWFSSIGTLPDDPFVPDIEPRHNALSSPKMAF